jgi:hypothetical protein
MLLVEIIIGEDFWISGCGWMIFAEVSRGK